MAPFPLTQLLLRDHWSHHHPQVLLQPVHLGWTNKLKHCNLDCVCPGEQENEPHSQSNIPQIWIASENLPKHPPSPSPSPPSISQQPSPGTAASPSSSTSHGHRRPQRPFVPPGTGCSSPRGGAPTRSTSPARRLSPGLHLTPLGLQWKGASTDHFRIFELELIAC